MYTTQVNELTRDLGEVARKHEGRDLTKAALVELFVTEACTIIDVDNDPALTPVLRHLQRAVEITASMPQTVDVVAEPVNLLRRNVEAHQRLTRSLDDAVEDAGDHIEPYAIAKQLLMVAQTVIHPDDAPIPPERRRAYQLMQQAWEALAADREEDAA